MFETFLKAQTVNGIRNAYTKSMNDGVAEYEIEFEGKAMDLAMGLSKTQPEGFGIKVTGITGNRITAEVAEDSEVILALQHRELPLHAVQFHPESVLTPDGRGMLAAWLDTLD